MKFLKLTGYRGEGVYVRPDAIMSISVDTSFTPAAMRAVTTAYDTNYVSETPDQIFELIHCATGETVEGYSWKDDSEEPDAVDTAIDEAYERGVNDTLASFEEKLAEAYERGRRRVAEVVEKLLDAQKSGMAL